MTNKHSRFFWAYVLVIVLFAVGLSLWIGMNQSIWFDEAYSIMVAKQPVAQAIHLAAVDIVTLASGDVQVLEVNAGIMMEHYARLSHKHHARAQAVYDAIVTALFNDITK